MIEITGKRRIEFMDSTGQTKWVIEDEPCIFTPLQDIRPSNAPYGTHIRILQAADMPPMKDVTPKYEESED